MSLQIVEGGGVGGRSRIIVTGSTELLSTLRVIASNKIQSQDCLAKYILVWM